MRTAADLRAEITKYEAKLATCKFPSTRKQWEERIAFLRGELRLQIAWENAGMPRPSENVDESIPSPKTRRKLKPHLEFTVPMLDLPFPPTPLLVHREPTRTPTPPAPLTKFTWSWLAGMTAPLMIIAICGGWLPLLGWIVCCVLSYQRDKGA